MASHKAKKKQVPKQKPDLGKTLEVVIQFLKISFELIRIWASSDS